MKRLSCRDVGLNCDYVMEGQSEDEVMEKAREHGQRQHGMKTISPDQERDIRRMIKSA